MAVAPLLFAALGPNAFFLNAGFYIVSLLIYHFGVADQDRRAERGPSPATTGRRPAATRCSLRSSHVWLLAPTWIAVNAAIGLWFSQSLFQFSKANPDFPDQARMRGFEAWQISLAAVDHRVLFGAGLLYWGNRFRNTRRTTIILYGILGGGVLVAGGLASTTPQPCRSSCPIVGCRRRRSGCSSWPARHRPPWACSPTSPSGSRGPWRDHGPLQRVPRGRPDRRRLIGGLAADWRGIDGLLLGTLGLLLSP